MGGHPALGGWNTAGGVKNGDIITIADASQIEYKWVDGDTWEVRDNRLLTLPALADPESRRRARRARPRAVWSAPEPAAPRRDEFAGWAPAPTQQFREPSARTRAPARSARQRLLEWRVSRALERAAGIAAGRYQEGRPPLVHGLHRVRSRPSGSAAARPPGGSRTASA